MIMSDGKSRIKANRLLELLRGSCQVKSLGCEGDAQVGVSNRGVGAKARDFLQSRNPILPVTKFCRSCGQSVICRHGVRGYAQGCPKAPLCFCRVALTGKQIAQVDERCQVVWAVSQNLTE